MDLRCLTCEAPFHASPSDKGRKNCSRQCSIIWRAANRSPKLKLTRTCACGCGQTIAAYNPSSYRAVSYAAGHQTAAGLKVANTPEAHAKAGAARRGKSTAIKGCQSPYRGALHWNWKGGVTSESRLQRQRFLKYYQPRVLARDSFTCQECGKVGGALQVDHILEWATHPTKRFDLSNCRTLCMGCHFKRTFGREMKQGTTWGHNLRKAVV